MAARVSTEIATLLHYTVMSNAVFNQVIIFLWTVLLWTYHKKVETTVR